jgi:hypothetical protein
MQLRHARSAAKSATAEENLTMALEIASERSADDSREMLEFRLDAIVEHLYTLKNDRT